MLKKYNNIDVAYEDLIALLKNGQEGLLYGTIDKTVVFHGANQGIYDKDLCSKLELPIYNLQYLNHGAIIGFEGDLAFLCIGKQGEDIIKDITDNIISYLEKQGLGVEISNNDIIIKQDEVLTKVGAFIKSVKINEKMQIGGLYININGGDRFLIEDISKKPPIKVPTALSMCGISGDDILNYIEQYSLYFKETI